MMPPPRGVNTPIFTSSSFEYLGRDDIPYPRHFNTPNQEAVVAKLCRLEEAEDGVLFSSGMAAMSSTVLAFAGAGDHVVMLDELYGGTHALATDLFDRLGIKYSFAATDANAVAQAVTPATRMIVIESPTNPLLGIIDIAHVARIGKEHGLVTVIDNTFATPVNQRPLCLGIDVVMHSGTKYLGGHSDLCCGVAVTSRERAESIRNTARHLGGSLNAISCSLLERSLKTLAIRVERQTQNASRIAAYLATHDAIGKVNYPGLSQSNGHQIARAQMTGSGRCCHSNSPVGTSRPCVVGRGDVRLLRTIKGVDFTRQERAALNKLTMPRAAQRLVGTDGFDGANLWWIPIVHFGNRNVAEAEVDTVEADRCTTPTIWGWMDRRYKS